MRRAKSLRKTSSGKILFGIILVEVVHLIQDVLALRARALARPMAPTLRVLRPIFSRRLQSATLLLALPSFNMALNELLNELFIAFNSF